MEVCVDSIASGRTAEKGGAERIELCCNLLEGGTTPSVGMLAVMKESVSLPVFVMIRPRGGDFLYNDEEFEVMKRDVRLLKQHKADGFVFGILKPDGCVDTARCQELLELCKPLSVTFHRAIDMTSNYEKALEVIISMGFDRVLTSGRENTALEGTPIIKRMIDLANGRIIIVPGGGINERNLARIMEETGAKEYHGTARSSYDSGMHFRNASISMGGSLTPPEFLIKTTDTTKVRAMKNIAAEFHNS